MGPPSPGLLRALPSWRHSGGQQGVQDLPHLPRPGPPPSFPYNPLGPWALLSVKPSPEKETLPHVPPCSPRSPLSQAPRKGNESLWLQNLVLQQSADPSVSVPRCHGNHQPNGGIFLTHFHQTREQVCREIDMYQQDRCWEINSGFRITQRSKRKKKEEILLLVVKVLPALPLTTSCHTHTSLPPGPWSFSLTVLLAHPSPSLLS